MSVGSDSHVTRDWREELRLLEHGQRLLLRRRNIAAASEQGSPASAERLFNDCLAGGATAAGFASWGLQPGARADLLVIDIDDDSLLGLPDEQLLDVLVSGRWVVRNHRHEAEDAQAFGAAMAELAGSQ